MRSALSRLFGVMKFVVPALYVAGATLVWLAFARSNPDGLANIWIAVYTFPVFIVGTFWLGGEFPYVPGRYLEAHALYFWPSVAFLALALFVMFLVLQKIAQPAVSVNGQRAS